MQLTIDRSIPIRPWPRIERYQNSTLRYTPPADFPAYWASVNGNPRIIRCWITLDEVWDYRTDAYDWNYQIGVNRYEGDPNHYAYDWGVTVPSQTRFEDYLTAYAACADEVLLNIRRYEREVTDGTVSYEQYEAVVEKVIAHCKALCPKIRYIEVSNESEIKSFGQITVPEYVKLYDCVCRAVARLNRNQSEPLLVGGTAMTGGWYWKLWRQYLEALAADTTPELRIDFYSMHDYNPDHNRLQHMHNLHKAAVRALGLPEAPMFFNEYGTRRATGIPEDSLGNAVETLTGMLRGSDLPGMHIFPWCTFHNPKLQLSYTQYLRLEDGTYAPTPNGQAMTMLHRMLRDEVLVSGDLRFRVRATAEGQDLVFLVTNPSDAPLEFQAEMRGLSDGQARLAACEVNARQNNCVTGAPCKALEVTAERVLEVREGCAALAWTLPPYGFAQFRLSQS